MDTNDDASFSAVNESENIPVTVVVKDVNKGMSLPAINESEDVHRLHGEIQDANEDWSLADANELKDILHIIGMEDANEDML